MKIWARRIKTRALKWRMPRKTIWLSWKNNNLNRMYWTNSNRIRSTNFRRKYWNWRMNWLQRNITMKWRRRRSTWMKIRWTRIYLNWIIRWINYWGRIRNWRRWKRNIWKWTIRATNKGNRNSVIKWNSFRKIWRIGMIRTDRARMNMKERMQCLIRELNSYRCRITIWISSWMRIRRIMTIWSNCYLLINRRRVEIRFKSWNRSIRWRYRCTEMNMKANARIYRKRWTVWMRNMET